MYPKCVPSIHPCKIEKGCNSVGIVLHFVSHILGFLRWVTELLDVQISSFILIEFWPFLKCQDTCLSDTLEQFFMKVLYQQRSLTELQIWWHWFAKWWLNISKSSRTNGRKIPLRNGRKCMINLVISELFSQWFYILFWGKEMDTFPIVLYNADEE